MKKKKKTENEKKITTNDITTPAGQTLFDPPYGNVSRPINDGRGRLEKCYDL